MKIEEVDNLDEIEEAKRTKRKELLFDAIEGRRSEEALKKVCFDKLLDDPKVRRRFNRYKQWRVRKKKMKQFRDFFSREWNLLHSSERQ